MSNAKLAEAIKRLLPGEEYKRIRLAIMEAANAGRSEARTVKNEISQENRAKTGKLHNGTIDFTSDTSADLSGFVWVIDYQIFQPTPLTLAVNAPDATYSRPDYFIGLDDGSIEYRPGTIDEEGNSFEPSYDPLTEVLLAFVSRNPDTSNTPIDTGSGADDSVKKSATGNQNLQSDLTIKPLAGDSKKIITPNTNGKLSATRYDRAARYRTGTGDTGWCKMMDFNLNIPAQSRYQITFDILGADSQRGWIWCDFTVFTGSGNFNENKLKVFGDIDPSRLKLVRTDTEVYSLFIQHVSNADFYAYRPLHSFGIQSIHDIHSDNEIDVLPAGDQYEFELFGGVESIAEGITLNGKTIGGVKRLIEEEDVLDIPTNWEYNVGKLVVDGIINCDGIINVA